MSGCVYRYCNDRPKRLNEELEEIKKDKLISLFVVSVGFLEYSLIFFMLLSIYLLSTNAPIIPKLIKNAVYPFSPLFSITILLIGFLISIYWISSVKISRRLEAMLKEYGFEKKYSLTANLSSETVDFLSMVGTLIGSLVTLLIFSSNEAVSILAIIAFVITILI